MCTTHHHHIARLVATVGVAFAAALVAADPSSARPDPGPRLTHIGQAGECLLQRVDSQLVRCDDLTGNGVPAPAFIAER